MATIRKATLADESLIKGLMKELLSDTAPFGMDVVASDENSDAYWNLFFIPAIRDDNGVVLIANEGDGALFWPVIPSPLATKERSAMGLGVYVSNKFRGNGIATELRKEALRILAEQGVESVLGFVHFGNSAGLSSAKKAGYSEVGTVIKFKTNV